MRWILLGFLLLLAPLSAVAQTKASNPLPSYEGQQVGSIELTANPNLNTDEYRGLIVQKAGEPYSEEKVRESIDALNRTDAFSQVKLQVEPEPAGLKLNFVLEPAYYIGMLKFPGAIKYFTMLDYCR